MKVKKTTLALGFQPIGPRWRHRLWLGAYVTTRTWTFRDTRIYPELQIQDGPCLLGTDGCLTISAGFLFSPTGPVPDTYEMVTWSMPHDALYGMIQAGLLPSSCRALADDMMHRGMRDDADNWLERVYAPVAWAGVRYLYPPYRGLRRVILGGARKVASAWSRLRGVWS